MKRTPTKHVRIWLVVDTAYGYVSGVYLKKNAAARVSSRLNELAYRDVYCVRPAYTSDTKGKR